jgi:2,4-diaminopentanoate dehydrogenase
MINLVQIGIGPLGQKMVAYAQQRSALNIVAAVDTNPDIVGKDLGEFCGLERLGVTIKSSVAQALAGVHADVAVVTTVSSLATFADQVTEIAAAGLHSVSTCEELSYPWDIAPDIAARIDQTCSEQKVACVGTGVNPGYLMDFLPTVLSGLCQQVDSIEVTRVQDASVRRIPFQQKIGAALTVEAFKAKEKQGTLRHVGLPESLDFIANRLGWQLDKKTESLEPVIADTDITTGYQPITAGMARGVHQVGRGFVNGKEVITLSFKAAVGEPVSYDEVNIQGDPPIHSRIEGGVNGDIATCAITLNTVRSLLQAQPGLRTMAEIPPVAFLV